MIHATLTLARREILASLHAPVALIVTTLFLTITGGTFFLSLFDGPTELSLRPFFSDAPLLLAFFIPALTMGRIADERRLHTLDRVLAHPVTPSALTAAKFLAVLALVSLTLLCTLAYPITLATLGPLDWGPVSGGYLGLILLASAYTAIGLMVSSWTRDPLIAVLVAFFLCFLLHALPSIPVDSGATLNLLEQLSSSTRFQNFARGVLDTRDTLYFLTITALALNATRYAIERTGHRIRAGLRALLISATLLAIALGAAALLPGARADLTREQRHSLTPASQALIEGLDKPLTLTLLISPDLPAPDHRLATQITDLTDAYAAHGDVTVEIIAPDALDEHAEPLGVDKEPLGQRSEDQLQLRLVYRSVVVQIDGQTQILSGLRSRDNLEYTLSRTIAQLARGRSETRSIAFLSGFGGPADSDRFIPELAPVFEQVYGDSVKARTLYMPSLERVPPDIDALIVLNPTQPLTERVHYALDQHLMSGRALAILQSPTALDARTPTLPLRQPIPHDLPAWLAHYGVDLRRDLLLDRQHNVVSPTNTRFGDTTLSNPAIPLLPGLNPNHTITARLDLIALPFAGTLSLAPDITRGGAVSVSELILSDTDATRLALSAERLELDRVRTPDPSEQPGPHLTAVALTGALQSAWAEGRALPEGASPQPTLSGTDNARLLVVTNGDFLFPQPGVGYSERYSARGGLLFLNMLDWLIADDDLISIRNKQLPRLIGAVPADTRRRLQLLNIAGVPTAFALFSLTLIWRRRRRQRRIAEEHTS